jgi:hypothetical protein
LKFPEPKREELFKSQKIADVLLLNSRKLSSHSPSKSSKTINLETQLFHLPLDPTIDENLVAPAGYFDPTLSQGDMLTLGDGSKSAKRSKKELEVEKVEMRREELSEILKGGDDTTKKKKKKKLF